MNSRTSAKVTASIAVLGLGALCRCSLAFSLDALDSPNGAAVLAGAAGFDVAPREGGGVAARDATNDSAADTTARDSAGDGALDAANDGDAGPAPDSGKDAGVDLTMGLVAFYAFDETSGTSASDSSGNGHTATLNGGASF